MGHPPISVARLHTFIHILKRPHCVESWGSVCILYMVVGVIVFPYKYCPRYGVFAIHARRYPLHFACYCYGPACYDPSCFHHKRVILNSKSNSGDPPTTPPTTTLTTRQQEQVFLRDGPPGASRAKYSSFGLPPFTLMRRNMVSRVRRFFIAFLSSQIGFQNNFFSDDSANGQPMSSTLTMFMRRMWHAEQT